jgi:hypothetical protein
MTSPLAVACLILNTLHANNTPQKWKTEWQDAHADWDDLAVRAIVFGLAPQVYIRLQAWDVNIPPRTLAKLAATYEAQKKRNQAIYAQLAPLLQACQARQLRPIALKGIHLAATCYAEPALRPMNDIDLLFTAAELPAVKAMLVELGYHGRHKSADLGPGVTKHTSTFRRQPDQAPTANPYLSPATDRTIEPHTSLEESWFGLKVDITPGMRERAVTAQLGAQRCHVLANEDMLLHLCVHFCFHLIMGAPAMVQLTDLLVVTQSCRLDWQTVTQRGINYQAASYVYAALSLAHKLLGAPVPDDARHELAQATPRSLRRRIEQLDLTDILQRTQQKPLTTIRQRLRRGLQDRAETARWATNWRGRWQVWQTALQPGKTDTGRMLLRKS